MESRHSISITDLDQERTDFETQALLFGLHSQLAIANDCDTNFYPSFKIEELDSNADDWREFAEKIFRALEIFDMDFPGILLN